MEKIIVTACILLLAVQLNAQHLDGQKKQAVMDSIKAKYMQRLAWKMPLLRQAGIFTETVTPGRIDSKLYGKPFFEGKYQYTRTKAFVNLPVYQFGKNTISAGVGLGHEVLQLYQLSNKETASHMASVRTHNTLFAGSLTYTRTDSLFRRPIIFAATASMITNPIDGV